MPDIKYTRLGRIRQYISIHKHQKNARNNFSKWENVNIEKQAFDNADFGVFNHAPGFKEWIDNEGNLWGILSGFGVLGTRKEQIGFFPKTMNPPNDEWHGYPILPFSGNTEYGDNYGKDIPDEIIEHWIRQKILPVNKVDRLYRGKTL